MRYSEHFSYARRIKESDPARCREVIHITEDKAASAYSLKLASETWLECFNDTDNAYRCLLLAECRWWNICRKQYEHARL